MAQCSRTQCRLGPKDSKLRLFPSENTESMPCVHAPLAASAPDPSPQGTPHLDTAEGAGVSKLPA